MKRKDTPNNLGKKIVWNMIGGKQRALLKYSSTCVHCKEVPQTEGLARQRCVYLGVLGSECREGWFPLSAGAESLLPASLQASAHDLWLVDAALQPLPSSHMAPALPLCPYVHLLQGHRSYRVRAHLNDPSFASSPLLRPYLQIRSHSEVLRVRTSQAFWEEHANP